MDRAPLNFAFSSCPNDTFAFHALVHGLVPGPRVVPHLDDIEPERRVQSVGAEVTKISIARTRDPPSILGAICAPAAPRFWCGTIVVPEARGWGGAWRYKASARRPALLLTWAASRRSRAASTIRGGGTACGVDCGVMSPRRRFTYRQGLVLPEDLGCVGNA